VGICRKGVGILPAMEVTMPLSDTEIRKSKAGPKAYKLSDGGGLYLDHSSRWQAVALGLQTRGKAEDDDLGQVPGRVFGDGSRPA
jgi:hypothetical protein